MLDPSTQPCMARMICRKRSIYTPNPPPLTRQCLSLILNAPNNGSRELKSASTVRQFWFIKHFYPSVFTIALLFRLFLSISHYPDSSRHLYYPTNAIELLEQGRCFWGQLNRLRSPLDEVKTSGDRGKELADKFIQFASFLCAVLDAPPDAESQHNLAWLIFASCLASLVSSSPRSSQISRWQLPMNRSS
ncbi:hypothetical protein J3R83DRAFT_9263 [Lanmaoa asiatica]|nr:hypothetical protein J3R83DRAFT_9263 [Lanmaoa asiatica]